ncbi:MAG TPA: SDR family oxidoreductase [bacterium]|jgi:enoyl-[acyl-carrier protein] reductase I
MQDLRGKTALVTGVANKRSIAFAVAERLAQYGVSLAVAYQPADEDRDEKVRKIIGEISPDLVLPLDVTLPGSLDAAFATLKERWGRLDIVVHAIASAKREELGGRTSDVSLEGYVLAQRVSAYSLIELARAARPLMGDGGSLITLTYIGSERATHNYNVMGSAKAALEANVRYLAMELGPERIRVNAISAGPIRTLSASGIKNFLDLLHNAEEKSALKRNVTQEEVANAAAFLASSLSSGITGQTLFVDAGYNIWG